MTIIELTRTVVHRLGKTKWYILLVGILFAALLYSYAKTSPALYTVEATVFPLNASTEGSSAGGLISSLTGGAGAPKSYTGDAAISIEELANSRNTLRAIALERLPAFGNKTIAQLVIESANDHKPFYEPKMELPKDDTLLSAVGAALIKDGMFAKTNKNGLFVVKFTNANERLISPLCYVLVDKISAFYKNLKIKKASLDYNFTLRKMDSLKRVLNAYDRRAIYLNNTTLFTPEERIEYTIPKENLITDKTRVVQQFQGAASNVEEALWRLQKITPILEILDKPDPPFYVEKKSAMLYALIGLLIGIVIGAIIFLLDVFYKFGNAEINKAVFGNTKGEVVVVEKISTTIAAPEESIKL